MMCLIIIMIIIIVMLPLLPMMMMMIKSYTQISTFPFNYQKRLTTGYISLTSGIFFFPLIFLTAYHFWFKNSSLKRYLKRSSDRKLLFAQFNSAFVASSQKIDRRNRKNLLTMLIKLPVRMKLLARRSRC